MNKVIRIRLGVVYDPFFSHSVIRCLYISLDLNVIPHISICVLQKTYCPTASCVDFHWWVN